MMKAPTKRMQKVAIIALEERLHHARKKHPVFAESEDEAIVVIRDELNELIDAVAFEGRERVISEALDVAATAMRLVMGDVAE